MEHLLRTGEYELDAWSAANMLVQIYLAAALAKIAGYTLSLLRVATLVLLAAGLAAFFALLREMEVDLRGATVLTLRDIGAAYQITGGWNGPVPTDWRVVDSTPCRNAAWARESIQTLVREDRSPFDGLSCQQVPRLKKREATTIGAPTSRTTLGPGITTPCASPRTGSRRQFAD